MNCDWCRVMNYVCVTREMLLIQPGSQLDMWYTSFLVLLCLHDLCSVSRVVPVIESF